MTTCDGAILVVGAAISCADIANLCERVRALLEGGEHAVAVCDVGALTDPDLRTVDALARLQLCAQRLGGQVVLWHASAELQRLLALTGLDEVLPVRLRVEATRQAEQREQPGGVEEGVESDDRPV